MPEETPIHSKKRMQLHFVNLIKDVSFVFVGEEDGVPFPSEIDDLVNEWIATNSTKQSTQVNFNSQ